MIGETLGHFEITAKLGEGGMGEVWRARDSQLDRDVAIKILPEAFTQDEQRLGRFEREAKLLAQLNHTNIAQIYGLEASGERRAIVLELVEGPTLAERLQGGPMPLDEVVPVARQIALALEQAHGRGIIHRDLKLQNIKLSADGEVKVLDFGLAKALDPEQGEPGSAPEITQSPTLTLGATVQGVILGTAAYMAPEQAKGLPVDKRADIWAFGVVLWEMLVGRSLFVGDSVPDTLARVLQRDIDFDALPASTPSALRRLLRRCLERNPKNRLHDIADARIVLDDLAEGRAEDEPAAQSEVTTRKLSPAVLIGGGAILLALGLAGGWLLRHPPATAEVLPTTLSIVLPPDLVYEVDSYPGLSLAITRDGRRVAYRGVNEESGNQVGLYVRDLEDPVPRRISGAVDNTAQPFFSPDGAWIGFFGSSSLEKISVEGGRPVTLVSNLANASWLRASWSDDGRIVYDTWNAGLRVVPEDGGPVEVLTDPEGEWHLGPQVLPGTTTVLYFKQSRDELAIEAIDLDGGDRKRVLDDATHPWYVPPGHLLFQRDGTLFVSRFDPRALEMIGSPVPLAIDPMLDDLRTLTAVPQLAVAHDGTLVYAPKQPSARDSTELVLSDRNGNFKPLAEVSYPRVNFHLSPDGQTLAFGGKYEGKAQFSVMDLERRVVTPLLSERLDMATGPVFSADGSELFYSSYGTHEGSVLALPIDGGEPRVVGTMDGTWIAPTSASADGRWLVGSLYNPETTSDVWAIDLSAEDPGSAVRMVAQDFEYEMMPAISPDGDWIAYCDREPGEVEVFVERFPGGGSRRRVSTGGGGMPQWSPDGRELFFHSFTGQVYAVDVQTEPALRLGNPRLLFEGDFWIGWDTGPQFSVTPDGSSLILALQPGWPNRSGEFVVIQNWTAGLDRLFAARGSR